MTASVALEPQVGEAMIAHARFSHPQEACGLLAGASGSVRMVYCLTNRDRSPTRFTVDPTEHFRAMRHAEQRGWQIMGVFHSHPSTAAEPSVLDVAGALDPQWLYVVVGLSGPAPEVRAFDICHGDVTERTITWSES